MICATYMYNISYEPILSLLLQTCFGQPVSQPFYFRVLSTGVEPMPFCDMAVIERQETWTKFCSGGLFFVLRTGKNITCTNYIHVLTVHDEKLGFYYYVNLFRELGGGKGRCNLGPAMFLSKGLSAEQWLVIKPRCRKKD